MKATQCPGPKLQYYDDEPVSDDDVPLAKLFDVDHAPAIQSSLQSALMQGPVIRAPTLIGQSRQYKHDEDVPIFFMALKFYIVLSLFSGHRREGDIQAHTEGLAGGQPFQIHVVALDVIYGEHGDLLSPKVIGQWEDHIKVGTIHAFCAGPPCESWSIARLREGGPPPIRNAVIPWRKEGVSRKHLVQLLFANRLLQLTLRWCALMIPVGGCAIVEHPARLSKHAAHGAASIWSLPHVKALCSHPDVQLVDIVQGHLGAKSWKPTTLMVIRGATLKRHYRDLARPPDEPLVPLEGKDENGKWATFTAKAYPDRLCKLIALTYIDDARDKWSRNSSCSLSDQFKDEILKFVQPLAEDGPGMGNDFVGNGNR